MSLPCTFSAHCALQLRRARRPTPGGLAKSSYAPVRSHNPPLRNGCRCHNASSEPEAFGAAKLSFRCRSSQAAVFNCTVTRGPGRQTGVVHTRLLSVMRLAREEHSARMRTTITRSTRIGGQHFLLEVASTDCGLSYPNQSSDSDPPPKSFKTPLRTATALPNQDPASYPTHAQGNVRLVQYISHTPSRSPTTPARLKCRG